MVDHDLFHGAGLSLIAEASAARFDERQQRHVRAHVKWIGAHRSGDACASDRAGASRSVSAELSIVHVLLLRRRIKNDANIAATIPVDGSGTTMPKPVAGAGID